MKKYLLLIGAILSLVMQSNATPQEIFVGGNRTHSFSNDESAIIGCRTAPVPVNLISSDQANSDLHTFDRRRHEPTTSEAWNQSKSNSTSLVGFRAETDDYGQLRSILEANKGSEIDSLVVVGPMNQEDFKAIWDCAVYGNMQVLNLEFAEIENNAVPDYALYDPVQFDLGLWIKIRRIILPEGLVSIGNVAFSFMKVQEINIPSTVKEIGSTVFAFDRWLCCELIIPEGVEEIKHDTFYECNRLAKAPVLPQSLKKIGAYAFYVTQIDNIVLPDGLEEIGLGAFSVSGLSKISIPESCLTIGSMAFQYCPALKEISLPENLEYIPSGMFSSCYELEKVKINNKCKYIGEKAFDSCFKLKEVSLSPVLESIEKGAFSNCALSIINLPSTLQTIGCNSFGHMANTLYEVRCAAKIPPVCEEDSSYPGMGPFSYSNGGKEYILYVPYGSKAAYSTAWGWNNFSKIEETEFPSDGINEVTVSGQGRDSLIYDLSGRKVSNPLPGNVYITNGKKVIK